jgi:hypothetical protein
MAPPGVHLRSALVQELHSSPTTSQPLSHRRFASYKDEIVLIDPKIYGENPDDPLGERVEERVVDLATALASLRSDDYLTLQCKGFYEAHQQFCFLYKLPSGCPPPTSSKLPASLLDLVSTSFKPSLTDRVRLAYRLALSVSNIHNEGWLHKGIRSENVLFFPTRVAEARNLNNPRLIGFDFARKEDPGEYSEKPV